MKRILPLIFVAVLMIFAFAQTSEATIEAMQQPNGDYIEYWPYYDWDNYDSLVITYAADGNAYATALNADGLPDFQYYDMVYVTWDGYWYYTSDGYNWYPY